MNKQKQIINEYQALYPHHTLRKMSEQTGIQMTRIFRVINGQEMKLSEYEAFRKAINIKVYRNDNDFFELLQESLELLSAESLNEIKLTLMQKLSMKKLMIS